MSERIVVDWPGPITAAVVRTIRRLEEEGRIGDEPVTPASLRVLLGCEHGSEAAPCFACLGTTAEREATELAEHARVVEARARERRRATGRRRR